MGDERMMHRKNLEQRIEELTILRNETELSLLKAGCLESINEMTDNSFLWTPLLSQEHPSLYYQKAIQESSVSRSFGIFTKKFNSKGTPNAGVDHPDSGK